jgi:hypothetical protein
VLFVVVAAVVLLAALAPRAEGWRRPVPGAVTRAFTYAREAPFRRGRHRGADLAARPGATVRAACGGRVVTARWGVVTVRCGPWRVTHLPLAALAVRAGTAVREGGRLGTLAASRDHRGLHLGVRRAGDPFAYVDPLRLLPGGGPAPPTGVGVPRRRTGPRTAPSRRAPPPLRAPPPAVSRRVRVSGGRPLAPWPAWLGLGLALCGAAGGGIRIRVRNRRAQAQSVASAT